MLHVTLVLELIMAVSIAERVRKRRSALRAAGLRPVQIWVPDTRNPSFAEECRRQSMLLQNDTQENELLGWIETISDRDGWQ